MNGLVWMEGIVLLLWPAVLVSRLTRARDPERAARFVAASVGLGMVLIQVAVIHSSLPVIFDALGHTELAAACLRLGGHIFGSADPLRAISVPLVLFIPIATFTGARRWLQRMSRLRVEPWIGHHSTMSGVDVVTLRQGGMVAAVPGSTPQIIVGADAWDALGQDERAAVISHELAHLRSRHAPFFVLAAACDTAFGRVPGVRRSVSVLRLLLERAADVDAARRHHPRTVARALRTMAALSTPLSESGLAARLAVMESPEFDVRLLRFQVMFAALFPLAAGTAALVGLHLVRVFSGH